jgi:hypothetical protein
MATMKLKKRNGMGLENLTEKNIVGKPYKPMNNPLFKLKNGIK